MYTVMVMSSKGGVGKTTISLALADKLARMGRKCLIIELDLMGPGIRSMTGLKGLKREEATDSLNDVLLEYATVKGRWRKTLRQPMGEFSDNCFVLPMSLGQDGWFISDQVIDEKNKKINLISAVWYDPRPVRSALHSLIQELRDSNQFDLAIIDCPPGLGFMTHLALGATQIDDCNKEKSLLIWILVPEPTSFAAVYADLRIVQASFPGSDKRSRFVLNKTPAGIINQGSRVINEEALFTYLSQYFMHDNIQYNISIENMKSVFGGGKLHWALLDQMASHAIIDIKLENSNPTVSYNPLLNSSRIAKIDVKRLADMINNDLFSDLAMKEGKN